MKIVINEDQLDYLKLLQNYKKRFFKYWDKNGPEITDISLKLFGFNRGMAYGGKLQRRDVERFLIEYLGVDKAKQMAEEFLMNNPHSIKEGTCGGYNFEFDVKNIQNKSREGFIVNINVNDLDGYVNLNMAGGSVERISDVINHEDIGWEIIEEIGDCIFEYLESNVTNKTGIPVQIHIITYRSKK